MGWSEKVWVGAAGLILVVSMAVIGTWMYMEIRNLERSRLVECFRIKTMEEDLMPDRRILDDDASRCEREITNR